MTPAIQVTTKLHTEETSDRLRQMVSDLADLAMTGELVQARLYFRSMTVQFSPPVPEAEAVATPLAEQMARFRTKDYSARCADDVLDLLRAVKRRLTLTQISDELSRRGTEWSHTTVSHTVPQMGRDGILTNKRDHRGKGYGLAEWEEQEPGSDGAGQ